jgi:DNA-binding GntR family transcriptional regulator
MRLAVTALGQPAPRPRGTYVSKSDMVTDVLRDLITGGLLSPGMPLRLSQR